MKKAISIILAVTVLLSFLSFTGCKNESTETAIYVSIMSGDDANDGSKSKPFKTPDRALAKIKELVTEGLTKDVKVVFEEGEYHVTSLDFTSAGGNNGFKVKFMSADGAKVVFNSGITVSASDFSDISDESILSRLDMSVRNKVKVFDLNKIGLTAEDIGKLFPFGAYNTGKKYDNGVGNNAELFYNGERLTLARYPNEDFVTIKSIINPGGEKHISESGLENPDGGTVELDAEVISRISGWKEIDKAWAYGFFYWDWADSSTPVESISTDVNSVKFAQISNYGYREGRYFYFYNVLEELDSEGEYYIDRDNMQIYCYLPENSGNGVFTLTVSDKLMLSGTVSDISFEGISFKGVRGDIGKLEGNNISFINCLFSESYGNALTLNGDNNIIYSCELKHMGRGGFFISGGVRETLTPGNSRIENCEIHDFGEVYRTYQNGASVDGCGNFIIHNEIYNTPHQALTCKGNNNTVEYNYIHNTSYEVDDGGAFYAGRSWTWLGNKINYNLFENIVGVSGHCPEAIYLDDSLSGYEVIGNIVKNCDGYGILIGGGHDIICENNLLINCGAGLYYDSRTSNPNSGLEATLFASLNKMPIQSEIWLEAYPTLAIMVYDAEQSDNPYYVGKPARTIFRYNAYVGCQIDEIVNSNDEIRSLSILSDNNTFLLSDLNESGYGIKGLKLALCEDNYEYKNPPYNEMGRYKESNE